jgi:hypothetical protein
MMEEVGILQGKVGDILIPGDGEAASSDVSVHPPSFLGLAPIHLTSGILPDVTKEHLCQERILRSRGR